MLLAVVLLSQSVFATGWEWLNPLPHGNVISGLDFAGPNRILGTGYNGSALLSTNDGVDWTLLNRGGQAYPTDLEFANATDGLGIVSIYNYDNEGLRNSIVRTTDGGATWQRSYRNPHVELDNISFPSPQTGWAIGHVDTTYQLVMLHTTDAGETWTEQISDSEGYHGTMFFLNDQQGWISLYRSMLITADGGATWERFDAPAWMYFDLAFIDSQHGWGAGFNAVFRTTDGGRNWTNAGVPFGDTEWPQSLAIADPNRIWIVTSTDGVHERMDHILTTSTGGQPWHRRSAGTTANLYQVEFSDAQHGVIGGEWGTVLQTDNGGTTWTQRAGNPLTDTLYYSNISFADTQNGWMLSSADGYRTPVLHTVDGGAHWTVQYSDSGEIFTDLEVVSATNMWLVGNRVLHSTNGGQQWTEVTIPNMGRCYMVVCPVDQSVWIFAATQDGPTVHRSADGGTTWDSHVVPMDWKFSSMAASDANNVWITQWADLDEDGVLHSSDGGQTWEELPDSLGYMDGIFFVDSQYGWAISYPGILRTTDGGVHWSVASRESFNNMYSMRFADRQNGWMLGYNDAYRTTDGGATWQHENPFVDTRVNDLTVVDANHAWICGWHGVTMRFDGTPSSTPDVSAASPASFVLLPAYPNPFNATATISYVLPRAERISLKVFDVLGREVAVLKEGVVPAGSHRVLFDGSHLASGVYFTRLETGTRVQTQKMIMLK
jgi:photosystem II stability/assembly factor-like uncharacterized protein